MTYQAYNRANLEEAGKAGGELINMVVKKERQFWIYLKKNTSNYAYTRIKFLIILFLSAIFEIIFRGVFTLIFGPLWPVSFPLGFIKLVTYTCLGYIIGFEGAFGYHRHKSRCNFRCGSTVGRSDVYNICGRSHPTWTCARSWYDTRC